MADENKSIEWRGTTYEYDEHGYVDETVSLGWNDQQMRDYTPPHWLRYIDEDDPHPGTKRALCLFIASGANNSGAAYGEVGFMVSRDLLLSEIDETGTVDDRIAWHKEQAAAYEPTHPIAQGHQHVAWSLGRNRSAAEKVFLGRKQ